MLGMGLVGAIMALLLGGTLYGLASYRAAMGTCVRKLAEMTAAQHVKEAIRNLRTPASNPEHQARYIQEHIPKVEQALYEYSLRLNDTIESGRAPNSGRQELALVEFLRRDLQELQLELENEKLRGIIDISVTDFLSSRPTIRQKMEDADRHVGDLMSSITDVIRD